MCRLLLFFVSFRRIRKSGLNFFVFSACIHFLQSREILLFPDSLNTIMGNDASTPAGGGKILRDRILVFKDSNDWVYFRKHVIDVLGETVSTSDSQLAALVTLSMGRRGLLDYGALYSDLPSEHIMRIFLHAHEALILSSDAAYELFGSCAASMGDFMSVGLERADFDAQIINKLRKVFPMTVAEDGRTAYEVLSWSAAAKTVATFPSAEKGMQELITFHKRHLEGRLSNPNWMWADTAHLALIWMTSIHWQQRLHKEYGTQITESARASLAAEQISLLANKNPENLKSNTLMRLAILRALDVSLVPLSHASLA